MDFGFSQTPKLETRTGFEPVTAVSRYGFAVHLIRPLSYLAVKIILADVAGLEPAWNFRSVGLEPTAIAAMRNTYKTWLDVRESNSRKWHHKPRH